MTMDESKQKKVDIKKAFDQGFEDGYEAGFADFTLQTGGFKIQRDTAQQCVEILEKMKTHREGRKGSNRVAYKRVGDKCYRCGKDISERHVRAIYCFDCGMFKSKCGSPKTHNATIDEAISAIKKQFGE